MIKKIVHIRDIYISETINNRWIRIYWVNN